MRLTPRKTSGCFWGLLSLLAYFLSAGQAGTEERFFELKAKKFSYTPNIIHVNKGDVVSFRLISEDVQHGFYLDGYGLTMAALPGKEGAVKFVADRSGRFSFRCSITCGEFHPYMIGYLYVERNTKFYAGIGLAIILGLGSFVLMMLKKQKIAFSDFKLFGIFPMSWKFELTSFKFIRALFKNRWFPLLLIIVNLFIFVVIFSACFIGGFGAGNFNFGIMIVWILWWVLLMLFMVPLVGRIWCLMCPFPFFGDWLQRRRLIQVVRQKGWGLAQKWPSKWRNLWPLVIGFWLFTWFSGFFTVQPLASFILLGGVVVAITIFAMFFEKRTACLTICPVSGFLGLYSNFAMCEVRVKDPEICKKHNPKTCFAGNEKGYGCPWLEMPFDMNRNTYCGLCLECFKTCPYDNMAFNVRPFGTNLFTDRRRSDDVYRRRDLDESFKALTMLGIMFTFFTIMQGPFGAMKDMVRATTLKGFFTYVAESFTTDFLIIPVTFLLAVFLSKLMSGNREVKLRRVFINYSYCLVPAGLAAWGAFSFGIILPNGSYLLHILSDPFAWGWNLFGTANFPWTPFFTSALPYLQIAMVIIGLLFSLDFGHKFAMQTYSTPAEVKRGWMPMLVYLVGLHVAFLWLFVG